jgi:hypothetical protein
MTTTLATWQGVLLKVGEVTVPKEAKLAYEHTYPRGGTYRGKAEQCIAKVTILLPQQLLADAWMAEKIASSFDGEGKNQGGDMLSIKIYQDATPLLTTDYYVLAVVAQAVPAAAVAFPFAWGIFLAIVIPLVLIAAILGLFIISIMQVKTIDWSKPAAAIGMALGIAAVLGAGALLVIAASSRKGKPKEKAKGKARG